MANKNNRFIVAYYTNSAAAEAAAEDLKNWDKANKDIKLGAIGVLRLDAKSSQLEVQELGQSDARKGALWGTAIGAALGVLTAGVALIPGLIIGATGGGVLGAFNHKSLGMTDADRDNLVDQLRHGGAALGVMCDDIEVEATKAEMIRLGGTAQAYSVPEVTAAELRAAADAQKAAVAAVDAAVDTAAGAVKSGASAVAATGTAAVAGLAAAIGLDAKDSDILSKAGIDKASTLLKVAATPAGRANLARETGIDESVIYTSVKKVDLMRVKGIGQKYAALLVAAGVDSVPELGTRNPANLLSAMSMTNVKAALVDNLPTADEVGQWVTQAKSLQKIIS